MSRRVRFVMFGLTLLFDIGVILFCIRNTHVATVPKLLFLLLPWLLLGVCQVRWPRARATTQGWVGMLILLLAFALIAGIMITL